ncbi:hypothetical protein EYF80_064759 [Liparis tanakae]|uniref:Uncharacterized protein n=1 Tax=Liparis tanakae TaxID=230148 RepID=A0A4Z2E8M4_9TELE|nr:hypothetical protein EYF80_064759 [Liparis tanakae]
MADVSNETSPSENQVPKAQSENPSSQRRPPQSRGNGEVLRFCGCSLRSVGTLMLRHRRRFQREPRDRIEKCSGDVSSERNETARP